MGESEFEEELILPEETTVVKLSQEEKENDKFVSGVLSTFGQKEDNTLSNLEKKLAKRRLKFVNELFSNGYKVELAAKEAGYDESFGKKLMSDRQIKEVIVERLKKQQILSNLNKDWVILEAISLYNECKKTVDVFDKYGQKKIGEKIADPAGAWRGLENLATWLGMNKEIIEVGGTGKAIEITKNEVKIDIMSLADDAIRIANKKHNIIDVDIENEDKG